MGFNPQIALGGLDNVAPGVITGGVVRDPGSSTLTTTIEAVVALQQLGGTAASGVNLSLTQLQDTSKAFTASKDTYVYLNSSQALAYYEVANNAAKPTLATLVATGGVGSQFLAKVVTNGSRILAGGVSDLRQMSGADVRSSELLVSFAAAGVGTAEWIAPTRCWLVKAQAVVQAALAGTDAGTITLNSGINDVYTALTAGVITIPLSSPNNTRVATVPTGYNFIGASQSLQYVTAKTTAGGTAMLQLLYVPF